MCRIRIHNDGKGKLQSCEAHVTEDGCEIIVTVGYGNNDVEALKDLRTKVTKKMQRLHGILESIQDLLKEKDEEDFDDYMEKRMDFIQKNAPIL
jgi:hypothetical protein